MTSTLNQRIARFYDASSPLWEEVWGEHMHHGHYGPGGGQKKERRQAQIDLVEELLRFAEPGLIQDVLDMGCGIGGSSTYLARKLGAEVVGVTLSPVQAARATERARALLDQSDGSRETGDTETSKGSAQFLVADALAAGLPDASVDLIWSCESAEHMPDKPKLFGECVRLLRPGGTLAMATWCLRPTDAPAPPMQTWRGKRMLAKEASMLKRLYAVYCLPPFVTPEALEAAARAAGLVELRREDWSKEVSPFWDAVIRSAISPRSVLGLLKAGPTVVRAAFAAQLMRRGLQDGTIRFIVLRGRRAT
jgi:tocopherol O-methyltransferase